MRTTDQLYNDIYCKTIIVPRPYSILGGQITIQLSNILIEQLLINLKNHEG